MSEIASTEEVIEIKGLQELLVMDTDDFFEYMQTLDEVPDDLVSDVIGLIADVREIILDADVKYYDKRPGNQPGYVERSFVDHMRHVTFDSIVNPARYSIDFETLKVYYVDGNQYATAEVEDKNVKYKILIDYLHRFNNTSDTGLGIRSFSDFLLRTGIFERYKAKYYAIHNNEEVDDSETEAETSSGRTIIDEIFADLEYRLKAFTDIESILNEPLIPPVWREVYPDMPAGLLHTIESSDRNLDNRRLDSTTKLCKRHIDDPGALSKVIGKLIDSVLADGKSYSIGAQSEIVRLKRIKDLADSDTKVTLKPDATSFRASQPSGPFSPSEHPLTGIRRLGQLLGRLLRKR